MEPRKVSLSLEKLRFFQHNVKSAFFGKGEDGKNVAKKDRNLLESEHRTETQFSLNEMMTLKNFISHFGRAEKS